MKLRPLNTNIKKISKTSDYWINTSDGLHSYAFTVDQHPTPTVYTIPTIQYDNSYKFPLLTIYQTSSSIKLYAIELVRTSTGWNLRLRAYVDGAQHTFEVGLSITG